MTCGYVEGGLIEDITRYIITAVHIIMHVERLTSIAIRTDVERNDTPLV